MASSKKKKKSAPKAQKAAPAKKLVKKAVKPAKKAMKKPANKNAVLKKNAKKTTTTKAKPVLKLVKKTAAKKSASLEVGSVAPDFTMPATLAGTVSSTSLKGKPFILYFYPKDDTSGCTAEACEFRNTLSVFNNLGVEIIGVSKDSMESHEKFSRKYNLTFPLASDEDGVCEKFGTWVQKSMYGRSYMGIERSTFLIDGKGVIRAIWRKVSVPGHIEEVKKAVQSL